MVLKGGKEAICRSLRKFRIKRHYLWVRITGIMSTTRQFQLVQQLVKVGTRKEVYHPILWLMVFGILTSLNASSQPKGIVWLAESINLLFYALMVYVTLWYLIPTYLNEKRSMVFGLLLTGLAAVITPVKTMTLYLLLSYDTAAQSLLLEEQFFIFLTLFVVGGGTTLTHIVSEWLRIQRERKELQTKTMQSELRFLKSQINPHFLFNTLNNLYALTLKKSDKAPEIVIKLSEMMRYMLYECNEKQVALEKEVNYLRNYLDLESLRQGKDVEISFEVKGDIKEQQIAPLLFITFLENSFKHGLSHHINHGFVHILLTVERKHLEFTIENSKPEHLQQPERRRVGGIGLVNVRRRLNLLYPGQHDLHISESPHSYAVTLSLELD
jgi:two-component system LytT family sensor kinase